MRSVRCMCVDACRRLHPHVCGRVRMCMCVWLYVHRRVCAHVLASCVFGAFVARSVAAPTCATWGFQTGHVCASRTGLAQDKLREARGAILHLSCGLGKERVELVHLQPAIQHRSVRINRQAGDGIDLGQRTQTAHVSQLCRYEGRGRGSYTRPTNTAGLAASASIPGQ